MYTLRQPTPSKPQSQIQHYELLYPSLKHLLLYNYGSCRQYNSPVRQFQRFKTKIEHYKVIHFAYGSHCMESSRIVYDRKSLVII